MRSKVSSVAKHTLSSPIKSNFVVTGDCLEILKKLPAESVDLIFADPPYNLQLSETLLRPNDTLVEGVDEEWDKFSSFETYDSFSRSWLSACQRILKPHGAIWVIGSYHNIFRLGTTLQDLGFWIQNDVIWRKVNPMPNFRGKRFTNAHETLIWASKNKKSRPKFNYESLKTSNDDFQMRSDWLLPICSGQERLKGEDGQKLHPTQKPESLIKRILLACTDPGDIVLDPFFGTGTTGAVAHYLGRKWIGIEREKKYARVARSRIARIKPLTSPTLDTVRSKRQEPRVPFGTIIELGILNAGSPLYDEDKRVRAEVKADGSIQFSGMQGSIHRVGAMVQGKSACNGWTFWHFENEGRLKPIDLLRETAKAKLGLCSPQSNRISVIMNNSE
ncbi:MAG: site-specific DNA-methyltransferase [Hyphomicrobium sp.]